MSKPKNKVEQLKTKIFVKYRKFSFQHLARLITENSQEKTTRADVHSVFTGRMTSPKIRRRLAALVGEPPETFWPEADNRKRAKQADRTALEKPSSIGNPEPNRL